VSYQANRDGIEAAFGHAAAMAQSAIVASATRMGDPHVLMRPRLFIDGDKWCALYGENLQDGVSGFGDSPGAACMDFDSAWSRKLPGK